MTAEIKPVMALNPYTEKLINVEPLFRFINEHGSDSLLIDDLIKHLIINNDRDETVFLFDEFDSPQSMYLYLYDLRNLFEELTQCEIAMPKKKGANQ